MEHIVYLKLGGIETKSYLNSISPGRTVTGYDAVRITEQQSSVWLAMVIILESELKTSSKILLVVSFLLAMKKSCGKRRKSSRYRTVDIMGFPFLDSR